MERLLEKIDQYILIANFNGEIIFANSKFLDKLGYKDLEDNNLNLNKIIKDNSLEIDKISTLKDVINKEIEFLTNDYKKVILDSKIFIDEFKNSKSIFFICKDIEKSIYNKEHLELLLDNLHSATFIKDSCGKYVYASKGFCEILKIDKHEIIGKYDKDIFPDHIADIYRKNDKEVANTKQPKLYDEKSNINGTDIWYEKYKSPIYDENNNLMYIIGIAKEIQLQKIVRDDILKKYNNIINNYDSSSEEIYILLNKIVNAIVDITNAKGLSIQLYEKDKLELRPYIKLKNAENTLYNVEKIKLSKREEDLILEKSPFKGFKSALDTIANTDIENRELDINSINNLDYLCIYPMIVNHELIGLLCISYNKENIPKYNQDGLFESIADKIAMLVKNYRLSQELNLENKKRKESEEELRLYLDISADLKATSNINGYIESMNDSWEKMLGWSEEELKSMHYSEFIHSEDLYIVNKLHNLHNKSHCENRLDEICDDIYTSTVRFLCKDNTYKWIDISIKYITDKNIFICTGVDVTNRKLFEEEKIRLEETIHLESIRNEFFGNISHEFKTPLNIILGIVQLIDKNIDLDNVTKDNLKRHVDIMKQNSYRLLRLVNNLIDISKIDIGYYNLKKSNYNIVKVIEDITLSIAEYVKHKNINLVFDTDSEEIILACDPDKMERVMLNLLSNAIKYTEDNGNIEVFLKHEDENVIISVKDDGTGIPKDKVDLIFDRFGQVNDILSRRCEGSGIGLSIVKSIIEMHEGKIQVFSELGKGSEFVFNIPIKTLEEENTIYYSDSKDYHIEKCSIEFSDIYNI